LLDDPQDLRVARGGLVFLEGRVFLVGEHVPLRGHEACLSGLGLVVVLGNRVGRLAEQVRKAWVRGIVFGGLVVALGGERLGELGVFVQVGELAHAGSQALDGLCERSVQREVTLECPQQIGSARRVWLVAKDALQKCLRPQHLAPPHVKLGAGQSLRGVLGRCPTELWRGLS
jgi:hypothetical protein